MIRSTPGQRVSASPIFAEQSELRALCGWGRLLRDRAENFDFRHRRATKWDNEEKENDEITDTYIL